jgi:hypothetical protein
MTFFIKALKFEESTVSAFQENRQFRHGAKRQKFSKACILT